MGGKKLEPEKSQMAIVRMCVACWITKATYTLTVSNTYGFSTAKMVSRTRRSVVIRTLPAFFFCIVLLSYYAILI